MTRFELFSIEIYSQRDIDELSGKIDRFCETREVTKIETHIVQGYGVAAYGGGSNQKPRMVVSVQYTVRPKTEKIEPYR